jgi:hypothetical protein
MVANFWRATQHAPETVALYADGPVNETDLHSRHRFLVLSDEAKEFRRRMKVDPFYFDPMIAGWWCWGLCAWIGSGWCNEDKLERCANQLPTLYNEGRSIHAKGDGLSSAEWQQRPQLEDSGGRGVLGDGHRPQLADAYARGRGVHGNDAADHYLSGGKRLPLDRHGTSTPALAGTHGYGQGVVNLNGPADGTCASRRAWLVDWFSRLRDRLRTVRVCAGHWLRVCDSESVTTRLGLTGLFLDAPYRAKLADGTTNRSDGLYATDGTAASADAVVDEVIAYCMERGDNPKMRIAACGYEGEGYEVLLTKGWTVEAWASQGGYANRNKKNKNRSRERIFFSPHCLRGPASLFDRLDAEPDLFQQGEQSCANETS